MVSLCSELSQLQLQVFVHTMGIVTKWIVVAWNIDSGLFSIYWEDRKRNYKSKKTNLKQHQVAYFYFWNRPGAKSEDLTFKNKHVLSVGMWLHKVNSQLYAAVQIFRVVKPYRSCQRALMAGAVVYLEPLCGRYPTSVAGI